jgi:hypothetical protein
MAIGAADSLDERRKWCEFTDQEVGIEIEAHFTDLGRNGHCVNIGRSEGFNGRSMDWGSIHQPKPTVVDDCLGKARC